MIEDVKQLTHRIKREGHDPISFGRVNYTYKFSCNQYLEDIDKPNGLDIKDVVLESPVSEFRISLNQIIYGDPAGKEYVEEMKNNSI